MLFNNYALTHNAITCKKAFAPFAGEGRRTAPRRWRADALAASAKAALRPAAGGALSQEVTTGWPHQSCPALPSARALLLGAFLAVALLKLALLAALALGALAACLVWGPTILNTRVKILD